MVAGLGRCLDDLKGLVEHVVIDDDLDLDLGHEVDLILGPTIDFLVATLLNLPVHVQPALFSRVHFFQNIPFASAVYLQKNMRFNARFSPKHSFLL